MDTESFVDIENTLPADFRLKLKEMRERYPGCVSFLPSGTQLYQSSKNPDGLVNTNAFDISKLSHPDLGVFFTLNPLRHTNIVVRTQAPLLFLDGRKSNTSDFYVKKLIPEAEDRGIGTNRYLSEAGFDGQIMESSSIFVTRKDEQEKTIKGYEVNIFTPALPSVSGGIEKYSAELNQ